MTRMLRFVVLPWAILLGMAGLDWWLFGLIADTNYFSWYLGNGPAISLVAGFVGLVWHGLKFREDLLSSHPMQYLLGCTGLAGVTFMSLTAYVDHRNVTQTTPRPFGTVLDTVGTVRGIRWLDHYLSFLVAAAVGVAVIFWLAAVAPLNYFVTIVSGAVARQELRGTWSRPALRSREGRYELVNRRSDETIEPGAQDISFGKDPFAVTQAIGAGLLWAANALIGLAS